MLNQLESTPIFLFIWLNSKLCICPLTVERRPDERGNVKVRMTLEKSKVKLWIIKLLLFLTLLDAVFMGVRLAQTVSDEMSQLDPSHKQKVVFQLFYLAIVIVGLSIGFLMSFVHPTTNATLFNSIYSTEAEEDEREGFEPLQGQKSKLKIRPPWKFNLAELISIYLSIAPYPCVAFFIAYFIWDPDRDHLLYSVLPKFLQNAWTFGLLLIPESIFALVGVNQTCHGMMMHSLLLLKVDVSLARLKKLISKGENNGDIRLWSKVVWDIQQLDLLIRMFNLSHCYVIFLLKNFTLFIPICSLYSAITQFSHNPFFALQNLYFSMDSMICFPLVYQRAFYIPDEVEQLKRQILQYSRLNLPPEIQNENQPSTSYSNANNHHSNPNSAELKTESARKNKFEQFLNRKVKRVVNPIARCVTALPSMAIKVGGFDTLGQHSILNFIDFISENVANLLISYH